MFPKLLPSIPKLNAPDRDLFRFSIFTSVFLHAALWAAFYFKNLHFGPDDYSMEIDLTQPIRIGGNPLLKPGGGTAPHVPLEKIGPPAPYSPIPEEKKEKPKDWVLPGPDTKELEKPREETASSQIKSLVTEEGGTGEGYSGTGGGFGGGDGQGGGVPITKFPRLLNAKEIRKMVRKLYPAVERQSGVQGDVAMELHIGADGLVQGVEIVDSPVASFGEVAKIVAQKMRFSPALMKTTPVAVKTRLPLYFRLEEE